MNKPKEGDRALVNNEPCVRVSVDSNLFVNLVCQDCPLLRRECNDSCRTGFIWVRETTYITLLLEQ